ncbi:hypothetical protein C8Q77DRAFT_301251 [Trametes polyzona]|nr:hypothetical protein C8Q77DRAFT_301251 [Trametes polyzona]
MTDRRTKLRRIAQETLDAIEDGRYVLQEKTYDLRVPTTISKQQTQYYAPDSLLSMWANGSPPRTLAGEAGHTTNISLLEVSTLEGARLLHDTLRSSSPDDPLPKLGVLNFASAKKPGGGFLTGAQAQEESIARSSTLYPTLMTHTAQAFYTLHNRDPKGGYYSHAMIYSPGIIVCRNDSGDWVEPFSIDVLTSPAVNAGVARSTLHGRVAGPGVEEKIEQAMRERMARILFLFETKGVRSLVLGSFGTGVFKNNVNTVAKIWAELLAGDKARFKHSFDHIVFAILGKSTFEEFQSVFADWGIAST